MTQKAVATTLTPMLYIRNRGTCMLASECRQAKCTRRGYIYHTGVGSCCSPASYGNARSQIVRVGIRSSRPRFCRIKRHPLLPNNPGQHALQRYMCAPVRRAQGLAHYQHLSINRVNTFLFILFFPKGISKRFAMLLCFYATLPTLLHTMRPCNGLADAGAQMRLY